MNLLNKLVELIKFITTNFAFISNINKYIADELLNILCEYHGDNIVDILHLATKNRFQEKDKNLNLAKLVVYDNICNLERLHQLVESNKRNKLDYMKTVFLSSDRILYFLRLLSVNYPNGIKGHSKSEIEYFNRLVKIIKESKPDEKWLDGYGMLNYYKFIINYEQSNTTTQTNS